MLAAAHDLRDDTMPLWHRRIVMKAPIALQLYTVREALVDDFAGVMRKIAEIGYIGVEPTLNTLRPTPTEAGELFEELGLEVPSVHAPLPLGAEAEEVLDATTALGCRHIVSGKGPESFQTLDQVRRTCDLFNEAYLVAKANDMAFSIHNHWWEFQAVEGRYPYRVMLEHLDTGISFEVDTYWVKAAGLDPVRVVQELGQRVPLLHIKDGPAVRGAPMVAVGEGVLDIPAIIRAGEGQVAWLIVELDECATDMVEAVEESYRYLVEGGLARGKQG
jgi:sugar phosphate isomerase/epimerase